MVLPGSSGSGKTTLLKLVNRLRPRVVRQARAAACRLRSDVVRAGESWIPFVSERLPELWVRTGEHLILTGLSTGICARGARRWGPFQQQLARNVTVSTRE